MNIVRSLQMARGGRTGCLTKITKAMISEKLGFTPSELDPADGDGKVTMEWVFFIGAARCEIWDYKGSASWQQFSTNGPKTIMTKLFGEHYVSER